MFQCFKLSLSALVNLSLWFYLVLVFIQKGNHWVILIKSFYYFFRQQGDPLVTMRRAVISFCLLTLCYSFANSLNLKNLKHRAGKNNFLLFVSHRYFERNYIWQTKNSWTRCSLHKEWDKSLNTCDGYTCIFPVMLFHWLSRHYWGIHEVISAILVCFPRYRTFPSVPGRVFGCQLKSIKDFQFSYHQNANSCFRFAGHGGRKSVVIHTVNPVQSK